MDEKLHGTLEKLLGESFKLVSDPLEALRRGLREMQDLATAVGDLRRVLAMWRSVVQEARAGSPRADLDQAAPRVSA